MWQKFNNLISQISNYLFPSDCISCHKENIIFCNDCLQQVPLLWNNYCYNCKNLSISGLTHGPCKNTFNIESVFALYSYKVPSIKESLLLGKYHLNKEALRSLIPTRLDSLSRHPLFTEQALLVPVPLHTYKQNYRGFNQSAVIASALEELNPNWHLCNMLSRNRFTKTQKDLKQKERQTNIDDAFSLKDNLALPKNFTITLTPETPIILIDDVLTSGSTLMSAAHTLQTNNYTNIHWLTLAKEEWTY